LASALLYCCRPDVIVMYRWRPKKPHLLRLVEHLETSPEISPEISIEEADSEGRVTSEAPLLDVPAIIARPSATRSAPRPAQAAEHSESSSARLRRFILQTVSANAQDARRLGYLLVEAAERAYDLNDIDAVEGISKLLVSRDSTGRWRIV